MRKFTLWRELLSALICIEVFQTTHPEISGLQKKEFAPFFMPVNIGFQFNWQEAEICLTIIQLKRQQDKTATKNNEKIFLFSMMCLMALSMQAQRCAVLEFHAGVGISQNDVGGISSIFITYFRPSGYTLVERTQIDKVLQEQGFQHSRLTEAQMVRIGKILNVTKIVVGDINVVQGQYNVDTRAIDVESGTIVATEGSTFASSSYRTSMQNLAQKLAAKIAVAPNTNSTQEKPVTDFVDLGLPSGTKWKGINQSGFYKQDDAKRIFKESLPTIEQWEELKAVCIWTWAEKEYKITGPNGNSITLPAMGNPNYPRGTILGFYWSSSQDIYIAPPNTSTSILIKTTCKFLKQNGMNRFPLGS